MLKELLDVLTVTEKELLQTNISISNALPNKILILLLKDINISQQQIEQILQINTNSYFKNVTLAKEIIYEILKKQNNTPYDDIFLVRILIFRGLHTQANKLILKLEEKYLYEKWFGLLDVLYHESFRMAYNSCDIKVLESLNKKVKENLDKYYQYTLLDKQLLLDMARCEKRDIKPKDINAYLQHLEQLYNDCCAFEHHVLEFNALHCLYEIHVNYTSNYKVVFDIIAKIEMLVNANKNKMDERIYANMLTHVVFPYCIYNINVNPEKHFDYLMTYFKSINHHFIISEILLHFVIYYFTKKDLLKLTEIYLLIKEYSQERTNQYKESFTSCLLSFLSNNHKLFFEDKNRFYSTVDSRDSLQCDLMLRYLEIILLIKDGELLIATDKIDATEKFLKRNFSISRVEEDKNLFLAFRKKIKNINQEVITSHTFRFNNFILSAIH